MAWGSAPWASAKLDGGCGILLKISIAYPAAIDLYFSDALIFDATIEAGGSSVGMAASLSIKDLEVGLGTPAQFVVDVANVRYIGNAVAQPNPVLYKSLAYLMTKYPFHGATVEITEYAKAAGTQEKRTIVAGSWTDGTTIRSGYISNITDITADSCKFVIDQCEGLDCGYVPRHSVGTHEKPTVGVDWNPLDEDSKGLYVPVGLNGTLASNIPDGWSSIYSGNSTLWAFMQMGSFSGGLIPARKFLTSGEQVSYAAQEKLSGDLDAYTSYGSPVTDCVFKLLDGKHLGRCVNVISGSTDTQAWASDMHIFNIARPTTYNAWIMPTKLGTPPHASIEYQKAIDGRLDTYMTLNSALHGNDAEVQFDMPSVANLGRIYPGDGYLRVFVYTAYQPPGASQHAGGNFRVGIKEPRAKPTATWQLGTPDTMTCASTGFRYPVNNSLYYPNHIYGADSGWVGTQWQVWNFTASGAGKDGTGGDPDDRNGIMWVGDDYAGQPFELTVQLAGAGLLYVIAIGIFVQFEEGLEDPSKMLRTKGKRRRWRILDDEEFPDREYGTQGAKSRPRHVWGRPPGRSSTGGIPDEIEPVDPEGVYLLFPGYKDTSPAETYGGGAGERIEYPGSIIQFLTRHYSEPETRFTVGSTSLPGTVKAFQATLDAWASLMDGSGRYRMEYRADQQTALRDAVDDILGECPGITGTGILADPTQSASAGRPGLYAMGPTLAGDSIYMHALAANGLSVHNHILAMPNGSPAVEVMYSPVGAVCNDIEVHYAFNTVTRKYGRIVSISASGSDDGYGNEIPAASGEDLCTLSESCFGKRKKVQFKLSYVKQRDSAVGFAVAKLWTTWRPQARVRFLGTLACHSIVPGMHITFNNDLYTIGGLACPILFTDAYSWTGKRWVVLSSVRHDGGLEGGGVFYEITAVEHLNDSVTWEQGFTGMEGTPSPFHAGEGFDI